MLSLTTDVPQNANGAQISLAEKYPAEMELAQQFIDRFRAKRRCNISDYKRQMLTLCLVAFSARKMERRIRIILMAHGQVGPAMAEVVNHVLQDDNAIGFSMGWDEPNEQVLDCARDFPAHRCQRAVRGTRGYADGAGRREPGQLPG